MAAPLRLTFLCICAGLSACFLDASEAAVVEETNIAPSARVYVESWLENMTPDHLNDGDTRFVYRETGWRSGTRFASPVGRFREEPLIFSFGRTEPSFVDSVELFSPTRLVFEVDADDGAGWRKIAGNNSGESFPQRISFPRTAAHSVRIRLQREVGAWRPEHYLVGEVKIFGQLRGKGICENTGDLIVASHEPARSSSDTLRVSIGPIKSQRTLMLRADLQRSYDATVLCHVESTANEPSELDFGHRAAGVYWILLSLYDNETGALLEKKRVEAGVRDPDWAESKTLPFAEELDHYEKSRPPSESFFLAADVNGLDSYHQLPDISFYLDEIQKSGAVAEIHFNWRSLEPLPGVYDFTYADAIFRAVARRGLYLKFCLNPPLAGYVPMFLQEHLIDRQFKDGSRVPVDMVSLASPLVREHANRLFTLLFKRYGKHPAARMWVLNVNGEYLWRIKNPYYEDGSKWALSAYREWLATHYRDIEMLNSEWGTSYRKFGDIERPTVGINPAWAKYCAFMMDLTADFYRPISQAARALTSRDSILLLTAGHQAAEPIIRLAQEYDLWQSNHSQENPWWLGWADVWRSFGISRFGEPGFVNIEPLDVGRSFFVNALCGGRIYTFRQYNWPNSDAWRTFPKLQKLGALVIGAEPMKVPLALVSTYESGLAIASNSFAVGATAIQSGAFYDALLKRGALASYYNGHNPQVLKQARVIVELGSQAWTHGALSSIELAVRNGAQLKILPTSSGNRETWGGNEQHGDILLTKLGISQSAVAPVPSGSRTTETNIGLGMVEYLSRSPAYGYVPGNGDRGSAGTGWNVRYDSEETGSLLDRWLKNIAVNWPFKLKADAPNTWACGLSRDEKRFILLYNNEGSRTVHLTVSELAKEFFPADAYRVVWHGEDGSTILGDRKRSDKLAIDIPAYGVALLELMPAAEPGK